MKKYIFLTIVLSLLAYTGSVYAGGGWYGHVTGGGLASAGNTNFSITVSAKHELKKGADVIKGQVEYFRPDLAFHGTVECIGGTETEVNLVGPARAQIGSIPEYSWFVVSIKEGGVGEGDRVRVHFKDMNTALDPYCNHAETSYPGVVYDGNFNIKYRI